MGLVTLSPFDLNPGCQLNGPGKIRCYYSTSFLSEGVQVIGSPTYGDNFFGEIDWHVNDDGGLTTSSGELVTTVNSTDPQATVTLVVVDAEGNFPLPSSVYTWHVPNSLGDTLTAEELIDYNLEWIPPPPVNSAWLDVVDSIIQSALGERNYAAEDTLGLTYLTKDPDVSTIPRARASNDLQWPQSSVDDPTVAGDAFYDTDEQEFFGTSTDNEPSQFLRANSAINAANIVGLVFNLASYGGVCDGTTPDDTALARALDAIGSTQAILVLPCTEEGQCLLADDATIPANVTIDFDASGTGFKLTNSKTLTIVGPIIAAPHQIFFNARSGQGSVSFAGNQTVRDAYAAWWGWATTATAAVNSASWNACNAALITLGSGEMLLGNGSYDINATCSLGSNAGFTGISVGGTNGLVGTILNWTGATNTVAIYVNKGRYNYLHDFYLINGAGSKGTSIGITYAGPGISLQTAHTVTERVTVEGFSVNGQAGATSTNSAQDESLWTKCSFNSGTRGFESIANSNSVALSFVQCSFALNSDYGFYSDISNGVNFSGCNGGSNGIADILFGSSGGIMSIQGWDSEASNKFLIAQNRCFVTVDGAAFRGFVGVRTDREATIEVDASQVVLNNIFHGGTFSSSGATGPHFLYLKNSGASADVTNCQFPDSQLPHISTISSESDTTTIRAFNNYAIDNNTNAIISRFPDTPRGQVVWTASGYPTDLKSFTTIGSAFASGTYSPAQITSNQDNYNPGFASTYLRLNTDASRNITGLTFTTAQVDGQTHYIINVGAQNIVLVNNATSTAANRFLTTTGSDITLTPDQQAMCVYDIATSRWRVSKMN